MNDEVLFGALVVAFALGVTAHVAIVYGLFRRAPRWRAPAALVMAPLAPYWAVREGMRFRAGVWIVAVATYAAARFFQGA